MCSYCSKGVIEEQEKFKEEHSDIYEEIEKILDRVKVLERIVIKLCERKGIDYERMLKEEEKCTDGYLESTFHLT